MTQEDYIHYLERKIANNQEKMLEINKENQNIQQMIESVKNKSLQQESPKLVKTKKIGVI